MTYDSAVTLNSGPHGRLGGGGPAGVRPGLEHERLQARPGQVGGGDETVVPTADNNHVAVGIWGL